MNSSNKNQILQAINFEELISKPLKGKVNAVCWSRELQGDFSEIVNKIEFDKDLFEIDLKELKELKLSDQGVIARDILLNDMELLKNHGASPSLNLIRCYEEDNSFFSTDVYSFHIDRSPIPTNTFLCTYYGESSEILPNDAAIQKVLIPEIRSQLKNLYDGHETGFDSFLSEYFFDLHYQAIHKKSIIKLGIGNIWRLAVDHPESETIPCIHRAPKEENGLTRLLLIC